MSLHLIKHSENDQDRNYQGYFVPSGIFHFFFSNPDTHTLMRWIKTFWHMCVLTSLLFLPALSGTNSVCQVSSPPSPSGDSSTFPSWVFASFAWGIRTEVVKSRTNPSEDCGVKKTKVEEKRGAMQTSQRLWNNSKDIELFSDYSSVAGL